MQSDLAHARQMIDMFSKVWPAMPRRVVNTHEDADHVWGNQLFEGAEIIAHRSVPEGMKHVADPKESQKLLHGSVASSRAWCSRRSTLASWLPGSSC
jgi:glyoxylase-like metal-dependent hydrolase (beta-lactamase superfamily II)